MSAQCAGVWRPLCSLALIRAVTFDGAGTVGVGLDHDTHFSYYETRELHRHLAFLNFVIAGVRVGSNTSDANVPSAEMLFLNCIFANSTAGVSLLSWNGECAEGCIGTVC